MTCPKCDRPTCPALTVPFTILPDERRNPASHSARTAAAYADCTAHAVDWRARALEAERLLGMATGVLYCADMLERDTVDQSEWSGPAQSVFEAVRQYRAALDAATKGRK